MKLKYCLQTFKVILSLSYCTDTMNAVSVWAGGNASVVAIRLVQACTLWGTSTFYMVYDVISVVILSQLVKDLALYQKRGSFSLYM